MQFKITTSPSGMQWASSPVDGGELSKSGLEGLAERTWPGRRLRIGEAIIQVQDLRARCVMTTFDPDTLAPSPQVLRDIVKRFDGKLALNCDVLKGGIIRVGQEVELLAAPETMHA